VRQLAPIGLNLLDVALAATKMLPVAALLGAVGEILRTNLILILLIGAGQLYNYLR